jgi:hypothetical protein
MLNKPRKDKLTGTEFIPERSNQLFATRANQIRYNNELARKKREAKKPLDRILDTNRTIIYRLLGQAKAGTYNKDYLLGAGFNFSVYTYVTRDVNNHLVFAIYDVAIVQTTENEYKVIKR